MNRLPQAAHQASSTTWACRRAGLPRGGGSVTLPPAHTRASPLILLTNTHLLAHMPLIHTYGHVHMQTCTHLSDTLHRLTDIP